MLFRLPEDDVYPEARLESGDSVELQLFHRIRDGDRIAFELLFRLYHARLCSFVNEFVRSREISKDIVQTLFLKVWEKRDGLRITSSMNAYLYRIARNLAIDFLKHQQIEQRWRDEVLMENARDAGLEDVVDKNDVLEVLQRSIGNLPHRCRLIFTMHWRQDLSYNEIASILGLSVKTVDGQMGRAYRHLRKRLLPYLSLLLTLILCL